MDTEVLKRVVADNADKITYPFSHLYKMLGYDNLIFLIDMYGGTTLYIPRLHWVFKDCISIAVRKDFGRLGMYELCQKYGISERTIKDIVKEREA